MIIFSFLCLFFLFQIGQVKQELSRKDTELLALQTKLETLTNQFSDSKQHIEVLKESLTAKEQRAAILQTEVRRAIVHLLTFHRARDKKYFFSSCFNYTIPQWFAIACSEHIVSLLIYLVSLGQELRVEKRVSAHMFLWINAHLYNIIQ